MDGGGEFGFEGEDFKLFAVMGVIFPVALDLKGFTALDVGEGACDGDGGLAVVWREFCYCVVIILVGVKDAFEDAFVLVNTIVTVNWGHLGCGSNREGEAEEVVACFVEVIEDACGLDVVIEEEFAGVATGSDGVDGESDGGTGFDVVDGISDEDGGFGAGLNGL